MRLWSEMQYRSKLKQGRGQGVGVEYTPWIHVQDFSSCGTISRVLGWKSKRVHHFVSNNELRYFYQLEWLDSVLDIREQFPLLDVCATTNIARQAGIKHPVNSQSGFPYVLTTDFLITTINGVFARTVKHSTELRKQRVLEKLEIERRYWAVQGIDWQIITEQEICWQMAYNVEWLHNSQTLKGLCIEETLLNKALHDVKALYDGTDRSIFSICEELDSKYGVSSGLCLRLFKYLAANKLIKLDMDVKLNLSQPRPNMFAEVFAV